MESEKRAKYEACDGAPIAHMPPPPLIKSKIADIPKEPPETASPPAPPIAPPDSQSAVIIAATLAPTYAFTGTDVLDANGDAIVKRVQANLHRDLNVGKCDYNTDRAFSVTELREREEDFPEPESQEPQERYSFMGFPE